MNPETEIKQSFGTACRRAGIEGFTFHDLRRCYLNRLRQKGVSIETAMQLTAHKSLQTVLLHYREVPYQDLEDAVAALWEARYIEPNHADTGSRLRRLYERLALRPR